MAGTPPCDVPCLLTPFLDDISSHESNKLLPENSCESLLTCDSDIHATTLSREASSNDPDSFTQSQGESSDAEAASITLCLTKLNGDATTVTVFGHDRTESLRRLVWDSLGVSPAEQQLICRAGVVLENGKTLYEQAVNDGDVIQVVGSIIAAKSVKVQGHRWLHCVNGVYELTGKKGDLPIYGRGSFQLAYDDCASRWAITDGAAWNNYTDKAYACCECDMALPYDLADSWMLFSGGRSYSRCENFAVTELCEDRLENSCMAKPLASPDTSLI